MAALATVGTLVRVTPWDDLLYWPRPDSTWEFVDDRRPFVFRVEGWLEDGHIRYGLHGPVVDGPERHLGLRCSILTREDGSDWRVDSSSSAAFKVGPNVAVRDHRYDFRHPEGTTLDGYPRMARFGAVEVVAALGASLEPGTALNPEFGDEDLSAKRMNPMLLASYRSPKTEVRPSAIGGRGLFATAPIRPGEIVSVKGGHLLDRAGMAAHGGGVGDAELQITDDLFLAPLGEAEFGAVMMFLNHSCEPNVGVQGQIVFVAMRDVAAGEELTLDYATIDDGTPPLTCRCGAAACRGVVTGQDWQRPELQRKYGRYFAWYLLAKMHAEPVAGPDPAVRPER